MKLLDEEIRKLNRLTQSFSLGQAFAERVMKAISDAQEMAGISRWKILRFLVELGKSEKVFGHGDLPVKEELTRILGILGIRIAVKDLKEALLQMKESSLNQFELSDESLEAVVGGGGEFDGIDLLKMRDRAVEILERVADIRGKGSN